MAKNYIQKGEVMPWTVTGAAITSGQVVVLGSVIGISLGDYAVGDVAEIALCGVFEVPKATGAITQGAPVYWDADGNPAGTTAGTGAATTTSDGNKLAGYAFAAAGSNDTTAIILLGWAPVVDDITASAAEINILDGATLSTAELNKLDGAGAVVASGTQVAHAGNLATDANGTAIAAAVNGLRDALVAFGIMAAS